MKNLEPQDVGWFSHENPMEFDIHAFRYHSSALRFWGGTPSILPFACATAGLKLLNEIGMSTIRKTNLDLKNQLRRGLTSLGLKVLTPLAEQEQGGTLTVMFENPAGVVQRLMKRQISADWRPHYGVRFSPHVYNTPQDVETVVQALTEEHDTNYGTTQKNHPL
jgi:selenocysteine lyase/cysteine desulfurase